MINVVRILEIMIVMTIVPLWVGTLFLPLEKKGTRLPFCWISGQVLIWAGFQCICVPAILLGGSFREMERVFFCYVGVLALLAAVLALLRRRKDVTVQSQERERSEKEKQPYREADPGREPGAGKNRAGAVLWAAFALLLGLQLFLLCFLSYNEGDDAYYVAVAAAVNPAGRMYVVHPYTGSATELDARHALAPLPMWVSVMSEISGLPAAAAAHVALPLILVPMTYCLYYLLGKKLVGAKSGEKAWEMPLFMCFTALLVLFGGYSNFTAENFLLVRGAQGKSVLANLIIPFLVYLLFCLMEKLDRGEKTGLLSWILIGAVMAAGCLCSTLGCLLVCMLLGISVVLAGLVYHSWRTLAGAVFCMVLPFLFACLYLAM